MSNTNQHGRGQAWLSALTEQAKPLDGFSPSVRVADAQLAGRAVRYIAVVPDPSSRFHRARQGEVGLIEGWELARAVEQIVTRDHDLEAKTPIVAVIDVPSQAYGRTEEAFGIHQALASAAAAYAKARLAGHPVIGLIVGTAMSGAFLAHGYQANRLTAIRDPGVMVHAMGKESTARITLRSVEALESLASSIAPMAYDIDSYASLGLLYACLTVDSPDAPTPADVCQVRQSLHAALEDISRDPRRDLGSRLGAVNRKASATVREVLAKQWNASSP